MTGRQLLQWLTDNSAMDMPIVLRGFIDLGDGDEDNTETELDESLLYARAGQVTISCL